MHIIGTFSGFQCCLEEHDVHGSSVVLTVEFINMIHLILEYGSRDMLLFISVVLQLKVIGVSLNDVHYRSICEEPAGARVRIPVDMNMFVIVSLYTTPLGEVLCSHHFIILVIITLILDTSSSSRCQLITNIYW